MSDPIVPGFILIHGNQSETLRDLLRDWVRAHPLAPLENEIILVQSNGVAQWLSLSLAADPAGEGESGGGLGIAAALDLQLPSRFIWQAYRQVLGEAEVPLREPFGKDLLTWRLMRLLPALLADPVFAPLKRFLQDDPELRRRHQLAMRLADLFDQYQVYRADWLADWAAGRDVLHRPGREALALDVETRWQAALWRALMADAGPLADGNRATIHQRFMQACAVAQPGQRPPGLPRRVLVFGVSALPRQALDVLAMLGRWCQVLMCVQNPCRHYWADIVPERSLLSAQRFRHLPRAASAGRLPRLSGIDHGHALLASWGRQGRDLIGLLAEHDDPDEADARMHRISRRADVFVDLPGDTLLSQLQQDILDLEPLADSRQRWPAVDAARDVSIRFHVCHGAQREVEVLHDQLLSAFAADPSLRPRDVIVMVPDVQAFAPHIEAVFGLYPPDDRRCIPFSIVDLQQRSQDPLLRAIEFLLSLPQARLTASEVLDLLDVSAVQQRFGIDEDAMPQVRLWIGKSGIRWGLDRSQRASLDVGDPLDRNSWHFGLQRLLLGYAIGQAGNWSGVEALDEVSGLQAQLLGRLMALVQALSDTWRDLVEPAPPEVWAERLRAMLARFFEATDEHDALILLRLENALQQWLADCAETRMELPLPLSVVREHWLASVDEDSLGRRFFGGAVTFATLMPMRAIPFRLVCLLGMNDKDFPRERQPADFDLMARDYRPGDRSRREDDRYLFLEALLSARDRLYLSWSGRSALDDSVQPPSVLVAQLRDHLAAGWRLQGAGADPGGSALLDRLTTTHRLQPFAQAYFAEAEPVGKNDDEATNEKGGRLLPPGDGLFSHAHEWAQALRLAESAGHEQERATGEAARLGAEGMPERITLDDLVAFIDKPVRSFFNRRLDIHLGRIDDENLDVEPFVLDRLQRWKMTDQLIADARHGVQRGQAVAALLDSGLQRHLRGGELPAGGFGELLATDLHDRLSEMLTRYAERLAECPVEVEDLVFDWRPDDEARSRGLPAVYGRIDQLRGTPEGLRVRLLLNAGSLIDGDSGGKASYRHDRLLRYWVPHVAAHLHHGEPMMTEVLGTQGVVKLPALAREQAEVIWHGMLRAWHEGMCRPLPFAARTAANWHFEREKWSEAGDEAPSGSKARTSYEGAERPGRGARGECRGDPYLQRTFADFEALWSGGEFDGWVQALMSPLIEHLKAGKPGRARDEAGGEVAGGAAAGQAGDGA